MKQLNEEMLVNVSGGDYGDHEIEKETGKPLYQIGEQVEMYITAFHIHTKRGTIIDIRKLPMSPYEYLIQIDDETYWAYAADIERK
ncbi:MAG: hypothetical protein Q4C49_11310 [Bacillota bacterium]|nr:hypothetical protein [Bacillota bacterium]